MTFRLAMSLLNFVWEGAIIAALLALVLTALRRAPAQTRYLAACTAMASMFLSFLANFALLGSASLTAAAGVGGPTFALAGAPLLLPAAWTGHPELPLWTWAAALWSAGVAVFYIRALGGWARVQRLRSQAVLEPPAVWISRLR